MGLGTLLMLGMLWTPGQAKPGDIFTYNKANLDIPIRYDAEKKNTIREMLLFVSQNQGVSWEQYAVATPEKDSFFPFVSPSDGTYWFQIVIVDKQGRRDPADLNSKLCPPPLKVLVDTKAPAITIKSLERNGDEAIVSWDIQEANPDWSKFQVEYRGADGSWVRVDAKGCASGSAKFRVVAMGQLSVRIQAWDIAGNHGQATRDAAPQPIVVAGGPNDALTQSTLRVNAPADVIPPIDPIAPVLPPVDPPHDIQKTASVAPPPAPAQPIRSDMVSPLADSPNSTYMPAYTSTGMNLPAPQIINVARFDLAYDVEQKGPSGIGKAEVWVTRDDGKSWKKWSTTEKAESPVTVELATRDNPQVEGIYGLKIVLQSGAGLSKGPPLAGEPPEMRVDVDLTPPIVKVYEPVADPSQKDTMILRWQAVDRNLANDPITLEWAEQLDGPWNAIVSEDNGAPIGTSTPVTAKRLPNTGQFSWRVPSNFPTHRVYLRVTARDTAGNVGEVRSPHPILVDMNKPVAHIHGIIGASAPERR